MAAAVVAVASAGWLPLLLLRILLLWIQQEALLIQSTWAVEVEEEVQQEP